jgi:hypothetical protein
MAFFIKKSYFGKKGQDRKYLPRLQEYLRRASENIS